MNNDSLHPQLARIAVLLGVLAMALAVCLPLQAQTNSRGEQFFIVSSVDQKTHQLVLMHPTQLTVAANITPKTICLGEDGKKMSPSTLRAGDTVWAILKTEKGGATDLVSIREGAMTQAELQKLYLHYSTTAPPTPPSIPIKASPLNPPPQSGSEQPSADPPTPIGSNALLRGQHRPGEIHRRPHGPGAPARTNP